MHTSNQPNRTDDWCEHVWDAIDNKYILTLKGAFTPKSKSAAFCGAGTVKQITLHVFLWNGSHWNRVVKSVLREKQRLPHQSISDWFTAGVVRFLFGEQWQFTYTIGFCALLAGVHPLCSAEQYKMTEKDIRAALIQQIEKKTIFRTNQGLFFNGMI